MGGTTALWRIDVDRLVGNRLQLRRVVLKSRRRGGGPCEWDEAATRLPLGPRHTYGALRNPRRRRAPRTPIGPLTAPAQLSRSLTAGAAAVPMLHDEESSVRTATDGAAVVGVAVRKTNRQRQTRAARRKLGTSWSTTRLVPDTTASATPATCLTAIFFLECALQLPLRRDERADEQRLERPSEQNPFNFSTPRGWVPRPPQRRWRRSCTACVRGDGQMELRLHPSRGRVEPDGVVQHHTDARVGGGCCCSCSRRQYQ